MNRRVKLFIFLSIVISLFIISGCNNSNSDNHVKSNINNEKNSNMQKDEENSKNSVTVDETLGSESGETDLKDIEFSKAIAKLTKKTSNSFELSIKITRAEEIIFDEESKKIFVQIDVLKDGEIDDFRYNLDTSKKEKSYKEIPLEDNKIPASAQFIIKEDSNLISEKEKALLLEGDNLIVSLKLYNPSRELMNVANIFLE